MKRFYSLSKTPGKTGENTYRKFFTLKELPYTYEAKKCDDIAVGVAIVLALDASGFSVSMPHKQSIIAKLDAVTPLVSEFNSCNTVLVIDGNLIGHNSDYYGAIHVLKYIPKSEEISILGNGAMGSMFKKLLGDRATVYSRVTGNWQDRHNIKGTVINCTSFGTSIDQSPFEFIPAISCVIDLAISSTYLKKQCESNNVKYVTGLDFYKHQFMKQFELYTGIPLTETEIDSNI